MNPSMQASTARTAHASHRRLTLFDLDGTLLPFDSNRAFGAYLVEIGWADGDWLARSDAFLRDHDRGELDLHACIEFATAAWRDRPRAEAEAARTAFVREVIRPAVPARVIEVVERHQRAGDLVAIVTATNEFLAEPIAAALAIDHLLAVRLERDADGQVTGRIEGTPSFHAGKIERVTAWLAQRSRQLGDFDRVTFYGDSINDVPLLEVVSHPVAANASPSLRRLALQRGWPLVDLFGPSAGAGGRAHP